MFVHYKINGTYEYNVCLAIGIHAQKDKAILWRNDVYKVAVKFHILVDSIC